MGELDVTVVIPTRDRPLPLERCLRAVAPQMVARSEIVVVDDASAAAGEVGRLAEEFGARLVRGTGSGPAASRNAGVAAARGTIVLFVDDDCIPGEDWVGSLARRVRRSAHTDVVAGATRAPTHDAYVAASELVVFHAGRAAGFRAACNLGCHRSLLERHPFDERFGEAAGEDREWCARVRASGGAIVDEPLAVVVHEPASGLRAFLARHMRYGRGAASLARQDRVGGAGIVAAGFREGARVGALTVLAQTATVAGFAGASVRRRLTG